MQHSPSKKLIVAQLVKKFSAFHENLRFITVFTKLATELYPEPDESSPYPYNLFD
jgi:hypothetical protein